MRSGLPDGSSCCLKEPCKVAGNEARNAVEGEYEDGMRFSLSFLAKFNVSTGTENVVYLKRENYKNNLDHYEKPMTKQIFSEHVSRLRC